MEAEVDFVALEFFADAIGPRQQIENVGGRFEVDEPQRLVARNLSAAQNRWPSSEICRDFLRQPVLPVMVDRIMRGKFSQVSVWERWHLAGVLCLAGETPGAPGYHFGGGAFVIAGTGSEGISVFK